MDTSLRAKHNQILIFYISYCGNTNFQFRERLYNPLLRVYFQKDDFISQKCILFVLNRLNGNRFVQYITAKNPNLVFINTRRNAERASYRLE